MNPKHFVATGDHGPALIERFAALPAPPGAKHRVTVVRPQAPAWLRRLEKAKPYLPKRLELAAVEHDFLNVELDNEAALAAVAARGPIDAFFVVAENDDDSHRFVVELDEWGTERKLEFSIFVRVDGDLAGTLRSDSGVKIVPVGDHEVYDCRRLQQADLAGRIARQLYEHDRNQAPTERIRVRGRWWRRHEIPRPDWEDASPAVRQAWLYLADRCVPSLEAAGVVVKLRRQVACASERPLPSETCMQVARALAADDRPNAGTLARLAKLAAELPSALLEVGFEIELPASATATGPNDIFA